MGQRTLFDSGEAGTDAYGRPRRGLPHNGKATSVEAAIRAEPRADTERGKVLRYLRSRGAEGATRDEAIAALGMNPNTLRPRWIELERAGWIANTGATRANANGSKVEVYVAHEGQRSSQDA